MAKGGYVDGFVLTVPTKKIAEYKKMASVMAKLSKKYGALDYKECLGVDLKIRDMGGMKHASFVKMAGAKKGETVWFSFIVYKSKKHQEAVMKKIMKDPAMNDPQWQKMPMPFDMKRMAYGGFKVEVQI